MFNAHIDVRKQMPHLTTLPFQLLHHEVTVLFSNEKEGKEGMEGGRRKGAGRAPGGPPVPAQRRPGDAIMKAGLASKSGLLGADPSVTR